MSSLALKVSNVSDRAVGMKQSTTGYYSRVSVRLGISQADLSQTAPTNQQRAREVTSGGKLSELQ